MLSGCSICPLSKATPYSQPTPNSPQRVHFHSRPCINDQVVLELLLNGVAPSALVLRQPDAILALGVVVAEELFDISIPIISIGAAKFDALTADTNHNATQHAAVSGGVFVCGTNACLLYTSPSPRDRG